LSKNQKNEFKILCQLVYSVVYFALYVYACLFFVIKKVLQAKKKRFFK